MQRVSLGARTLAALGCLTLAAGCNAILGINPPSQRSRDAGWFVAASPDDAGFENADAGLELDAGPAKLPPATHPWAVWSMPNPATTHLPNPQSYVPADGIVTDQVTQLQWQQVADTTSFTWTQASAHCAELRVNHLGGFRVPSRIELLSLIDFTVPQPTIDASAFPDAPAARFWSASPYQGAASSAWGVSFAFTDGLVYQDKVEAKYLVRCVRDGTAAMHTPRTPTAGTVHDPSTKLTWQQAESTKRRIWSDAGAYCAALDVDGRGWRLPTVKELQTLVDETRQQPAIDAAAFPNTSADEYWTSSPVPGFPDMAWTVSFAYGFDGFYDIKMFHHVRCVR